MTEERVELSRAELAVLCATVCGGAAAIGGAFFAIDHALWERLLGIFFISFAIATFLVAMAATARALLPVARVKSKPVRPDTVAPTPTRPVPTVGATKQPTGSAVVGGDRSAEAAAGPSVLAAHTEQVVAPPVDSDGQAVRDDSSNTQPAENLDVRHRLSRKTLRFLNRALRFMVTRIIPIVIATCGFTFIVITIQYFHLPRPKHVVAVLHAAGSAAVSSVVFSPDGTLLAIVSCTGDCRNGHGSDQVDMWNLDTRQVTAVFTYPGHDKFGSNMSGVDYTPFLAFNPEGSSLATANPYSSVVYLISSTHFGVKVTTLESPDSISIDGGLAFSPDGKALIATSQKANAYLWNPATRHIEASFTDSAKNAFMLSEAFSSESTVAAFGDGANRIYIWNFAAGTSVRMQNISYDGDSPIGIDPQGKTLAIGDDGHSEVQLVNLATGMVNATLKDPNSDSSTFQFGVTNIAFSDDGRLLAVADHSGAIYLWDTLTKRLVASLAPGPTSFLHQTPPELETFAFNSSSKILAAGYADGNVYLWDLSWLQA